MAITKSPAIAIKLYDGSTEHNLAQVNTSDIDIQVDEVDTTELGSEWRKSVGTTRGAVATFGGFYDTADGDGWVQLFDIGMKATDYAEELGDAAAELRYYVSATHYYSFNFRATTKLSAGAKGVLNASVTCTSVGTVSDTTTT